MALKPEASLMTSLAVGAVVYGIHVQATPTIADIRSLDKGNADVRAAERVATWTSAGIVAAISLLAKDRTIFILGGALTVGMAWWTRHADSVDATTKTARELPAPTAMAGASAAGGAIGNTPSGITTQGKLSVVPMQYGASVI